MALPSGWHTLPGPTAYVDEIVNDLKQGDSVWTYFPAAPSNFGVRIRSRLKTWTWKRITDDRELASIESTDGVVFWREIQSDTVESREAFERIVSKERCGGRFPRICILARSNEKSIRALRNVVGVCVRVWSDFVTLTDSRVVVERIGRKEGWTRGYANIMSSVISQVARNDLMLAQELTKGSLNEIIDDGSINREDIWAGQVQVLLPIINAYRLKMIEKYRDEWCVPYEVYVDEKLVRKVVRYEDLEIAHLWHQSNEILDMSQSDRDQLNRLKFVRNQLAHLRVVRWGDLPSQFWSQLFDIRIPGQLLS